jgi:hypothetical protein
MMARAITAPPMTPAATPGPHPHPRRRHWAETSVAVAVNVSAIVTAASKLASIFFIRMSPWNLADAAPAPLRMATSVIVIVRSSKDHPHSTESDCEDDYNYG